MGGSIAVFANPAIEKVAGAASADVDAIILRQAEIEDFGAAVIEWNSLTPSDLGQLLLTEGLASPLHIHGRAQTSFGKIPVLR